MHRTLSVSTTYLVGCLGRKVACKEIGSCPLHVARTISEALKCHQPTCTQSKLDAQMASLQRGTRVAKTATSFNCLTKPRS